MLTISPLFLKAYQNENHAIPYSVKAIEFLIRLNLHAQVKSYSMLNSRYQWRSERPKLHNRALAFLSAIGLKKYVEFM